MYIHVHTCAYMYIHVILYRLLFGKSRVLFVLTIYIAILLLIYTVFFIWGGGRGQEEYGGDLIFFP